MIYQKRIKVKSFLSYFYVGNICKKQGSDRPKSKLSVNSPLFQNKFSQILHLYCQTT